jgi:hypothetical protein
VNRDTDTRRTPLAENVIPLSATDPAINRLLEQAGSGCGIFSRHYNQVEEFFLRFEEPFFVPRLPIHHDVRVPAPEPAYVALLEEILEQLVALAPRLFAGLTYLFDPLEVLRPGFYALHRYEASSYLYLLKLDLMYRPQVHRLARKGSNDLTTAYRSRELFLESAHIPLREVKTRSGRTEAFVVDQSISNTWVDEIGRGYVVQGIWIDGDLTKFFSKLFLPDGKRTYPFYPYVCKYKTLCQNLALDPAPEGRKKLLPYLHKALEFLRPFMSQIESSLKNHHFAESNKTYRKLKASVPLPWVEIWNNIGLEMYLNQRDMKEYRLEYAAG